MDTTDHLELVSKLRQRLLRLIKLGEPNRSRTTTPTTNDGNLNNQTSVDLTAKVEEWVHRLFNNSCSIEAFIQEVQLILKVTIKSSLSIFLTGTIPLAHQYLQEHQYDPLSWETFKSIPLQSQTNTITRLPSLQQARFRLPPSCPQLIDLTVCSSTRSTPETTSLIPNIRPDANSYQQKLIHRFAQHNFYLDQTAEEIFLQTLHTFLRSVITRLRFYTEHRLDTQFFHSNTYEMTSNVREQIRFLMELNRSRTGPLNHQIQVGSMEHRTDPNNINPGDQKDIRSREYRLSMIEELRQREANETACLVLRESRSKRQKLSEKNRIPTMRSLRANLQDLILVMENLPILRRSKTLLYAYANR